uniref:Uncharacterized protein n=1 Tax=Ditylenchus dipsaci TaxID=166011 RepID=A0A915EAN3_9BILA
MDFEQSEHNTLRGSPKERRVKISFDQGKHSTKPWKGSKSYGYRYDMLLENAKETEMTGCGGLRHHLKTHEVAVAISQAAVDEALLKFAVCSGQPMSIVGNTHFISFLQAFGNFWVESKEAGHLKQAKDVLPSANTLSSRLDTALESVKEGIDVRAKCIDTMRQFAAKKMFCFAKEGKIKTMLRLLIDLLTTKKTITEASAYHRHSLTIIHHLLTVGGPTSLACKEAARSEPFFQHLLDILRNENGLNSVSRHIAINSLKAMMQGKIAWKTLVMEKGGIEILLRYLDVSKHNFKERRAALLSLLSMLGQQKKFAQKFVQLNGIQILTKSIFDDFSPEMVYDSMKCLCMVSDLQETAANCEARHFFLSNVLVVNSSAKKSLTLMREPRALEFIISIAGQCAKISNTNNKKFIANDILDRCLVAIHAVNREDNEERVRASKLMSANFLATQLFQTVMLLPNTIHQNRVVSGIATRVVILRRAYSGGCLDGGYPGESNQVEMHSRKIWFKMLSNGVVPNDLNVSKMVMKFIVDRIASGQTKATDNSPATEQEIKKAACSRAIITLPSTVCKGCWKVHNIQKLLLLKSKKAISTPFSYLAIIALWRCV